MTSDQIIYEDNHLLLVNKRAGELVQGDKSGDSCLVDEIKSFIKERDNKPGNVFCGLVHRIDRPVSGVVIFAKTSKALSRMNALVKERAIEKTYWAVSKNCPEPMEGELRNWLLRNERMNKSFVVADGTKEGAKEAVLDYKVIGRSEGGYYLIEVNLHTGRHHQIRCQLANIGCPIKGDLKYGAPRSNPDGSISLHSRRVSFEHPVSHIKIDVEAEPSWGLSFNTIN
ncbi:MAG: RNA pseudouridine synthase [Bacteroidales bacterium]|nr:RNA pseudouridine synthase [Bacteroidales bacterium]